MRVERRNCGSSLGVDAGALAGVGVGVIVGSEGTGWIGGVEGVEGICGVPCQTVHPVTSVS